MRNIIMDDIIWLFIDDPIELLRWVGGVGELRG